MKNLSMLSLKNFCFREKCNKALVVLLTLFCQFDIEIIIKKLLNLVDLIGT